MRLICKLFIYFLSLLITGLLRNHIPSITSPCNSLDEILIKENAPVEVFYLELYSFSIKTKCKYYGTTQLSVQMSFLLTLEGDSLNKEA